MAREEKYQINIGAKEKGKFFVKSKNLDTLCGEEKNILYDLLRELKSAYPRPIKLRLNNSSFLNDITIAGIIGMRDIYNKMLIHCQKKDNRISEIEGQ